MTEAHKRAPGGWSAYTSCNDSDVITQEALAIVY